MQARIRKEELQAFKLQASNIFQNGLTPILDYLKIEVEGDFCTITKSNNESFISKTIPNDSDNCCFLVNEKIVNEFIEYADGEYIDFEIEGIYVKLSCGRAKTNSQTEHPRGFPFIDMQSAEWVTLPKLALVAAGICAKIIMDGEISDAKSFVFVGAHCVAGSDGSIGYIQPIDDDLPELVLRKNVAECISKMASCKLSSNKSYDLFQDDNALYGFVKSEYKFFDLQAIAASGIGEVDFAVNRKNIMKFNTWCINSTGIKSLAAIFKCSDNDLSLQLVETKFDKTFHSNVYVKGTTGEFKFDPVMMNRILNVLPCDEVFFKPGKQRYYITDAEQTFISVILLIN